MKACRGAIPFFCFLLLSLAASAHSREGGKLFLWEAQADGGARLFLLGSVHGINPGSSPLDDRINRVFRRCRLIVLEADPKEAAGAGMQEHILARGTYPGSSRLEDHVSKKTYALLGHRMKALGIPSASFERYRPWLCAVSLSAMEMRRLGFDPGQRIDAHFGSLALREGKEVVFLETAMDQIGLLAGMPPERQEQLLLQAMREVEVIGRMSSEMVSAWKQGDTATMESILDISLGEYPEIRKALFDKRNAGWVRKIEGLMKKGGGDVLVIAGAGHLVGENGILALLRKRGYPVTQH